MDAAILVDSWVQQKKPGILCKLDSEKAYDHVNLNFLLKILKDMGFGDKWDMLDIVLHFKCKILPYHKWQTEGFFRSHRGLRLGESVPPFLLLMTMEGLNHMFSTRTGWVMICKSDLFLCI